MNLILIYKSILIFFAILSALEDNFKYYFNILYILIPSLIGVIFFPIVNIICILCLIFDDIFKCIGTGDLCFVLLFSPFIKNFYIFFVLFFTFCIFNLSLSEKRSAGIFPMLLSFLIQLYI